MSEFQLAAETPEQQCILFISSSSFTHLFVYLTTCIKYVLCGSTLVFWVFERIIYWENQTLIKYTHKWMLTFNFGRFCERSVQSNVASWGGNLTWLRRSERGWHCSRRSHCLWRIHPIWMPLSVLASLPIQLPVNGLVNAAKGGQVSESMLLL